MNKILDVKNLKISFSDFEKKYLVIRGASFHLFEGETLALVGESGSGKSVTARAIVGLNPKECSNIESGEILYRNKNLLELSEKKIREYRGKEIGMIFQDPISSLNPTMKVGKQVQENLAKTPLIKTSHESFNKVIELFRLVGISDPIRRYDLYPHELSGGMRQRVMISLVLAAQPKILIADEPTTALDVTIQAQILHLLKKIQKKLNMSIIFITHNLSLISGFCDRIAVMYAGTVVETATTKQLFSNPKHPYTSKLLQSIPRLNLTTDQPLIPIEGSPPILTQTITGCGFYPRCHLATTQCEKENPPTFLIEKNHKSACWLYKECTKNDD